MLAWIAALLITLPPAAGADDARLAARLKLGEAVIGLGATAGGLIWMPDRQAGRPAALPDNELIQIARKIEADLASARASSAFGRAVGDTGSATLQLMALADPEPISRITFMVGAYATQSASNYLASATYQLAQLQSLGALRAVLEDPKNKATAKKLALMSSDDLLANLDNYMIGNKTLADLFKDQPEALAVLRANTADYLLANGTATLLTVKKFEGNAESLRQQLVRTTRSLQRFRGETIERLSVLEGISDELLKATQESAEQLTRLREEAAGNRRALSSLAEISYLGWSTEQKIAALDAGLFPELSCSAQATSQPCPARASLLASLKADQRRENLLGDLQRLNRDIGSLSTLAGNLGMPTATVKALNLANTTASALTRFQSGDILGAAATLSGLLGGARDPAAERHQQLMNYLSEQFGAVHQRLERIERLQQETLVAIGKLASFVADFRAEMDRELALIKGEVLRNQAMLDSIVRAEWRPCRALRNASNQLPWFTSRQQLLEALGSSDRGKNFRDNWRLCNAQSYEFLDGDILTGNWAGGLADLRTSVGEATSNPDLRLLHNRNADRRIAEYRAARDFLLLAVPDLLTAPARHLARLAQPVGSVAAAETLERALHERHLIFASYRCNDRQLLTPGLQRLACLGLPDGAALPPIGTQIERLFGETLIGLNGWGLMDAMLTVSRSAAFVHRNDDDEYRFLSPRDIDPRRPPSDDFKAAIGQRRGIELLEAMRPLAELGILQQAIAYGDWLAQLLFDELYDPAGRALRTQPDTAASPVTRARQQAALTTLRVNPVLARNTVMLAVRKALLDANGNFPTTYYGMALANFRGTPACTGELAATRKLAQLLPGWTFQYRVDKSAGLAACPEEDSENGRGVGVGIDFGDFYVRMPAAENAGEGVFEYPQGLAITLAYREKIARELVDRRIGDYLTSPARAADFLDSASGN